MRALVDDGARLPRGFAVAEAGLLGRVVGIRKILRTGLIAEERLCPATDRPAWPFRMGKNPWRQKRELSDKQRAALGLPRNNSSFRAKESQDEASESRSTPKRDTLKLFTG